MIFKGYTISNLNTYRDYFCMKDLLDAVEQWLPLTDWIWDSTNNRKEEEELFRRIWDVCCCWDDAGLEFDVKILNEELGCVPDQKLADELRDLSGQGGASRETLLLCCLLCMLIRLYGSELSDEDRNMLLAYLGKNNAQALLHIETNASGSWLCLEKKRLERLDLDARIAARFKDVIATSVDEDTGFLGITRDGGLRNGSALHIEAVRKKLVKVLLYKRHYALLCSDGTVEHNWLRVHAQGDCFCNMEVKNGALCLSSFQD